MCWDTAKEMTAYWVHISACEHSWMNLRNLFLLLLCTVSLLILHKVLITGNTFWWIPPRLTVSENQYLEKLVSAIIPLRHDGKTVIFLFVLCYQFTYCNSSFISLFYIHCTLYGFCVLQHQINQYFWSLFLPWYVFVNPITIQIGGKKKIHTSISQSSILFIFTSHSDLFHIWSITLKSVDLKVPGLCLRAIFIAN